MIRQFRQADVGEILQRIYDSEINIEIHWQWDGGIDWKIGDVQNGYKEVSEIAAALSSDEWNKIEYSISALAYEIYRHYPESKFARWYAGKAET